MWFYYNINFQNKHLDFFNDNIKSFFIKTFNGESFKSATNTEFFIQLKRTKLVKNYLKSFYENYSLLSIRQKSIIKEAYKRNTNIEKICFSKLKPIKYSEVHKNVRNDLINIFDYLYDDLKKVNYFKETLGSFKNYYTQFYNNNFSRYTLCPFCGLKPMKTSIEKRREPFDHYLLKSKYPFVSLIRNNLVPICHDCNEDYKHDYDISLRKVFYPFSENKGDVELEVMGTEAKIRSDEYPEEVKSWNDIFDVEQRITGYVKQNKAAILSKFTEVQSLLGSEKLKEHLDCVINSHDKKLYCRDNFIEKAILLDEFSYLFKEKDLSMHTEENQKEHISN